MGNKLDLQEEVQASCALVDWLESQNIDVAQAIPVLIRTLASAINTVGQSSVRKKEGKRIVAKMIREWP